MINRILPGLIAILMFLPVSREAMSQDARSYFHAASREEQDLVEIWLGQDCEIGQKREIEEYLAQKAIRLEPVFWEAYRLGPPPEILQKSRDALVKRYAKRQEWLRKSGEGYFGNDVKRRLLSVTQEQYLEQEIARYIVRYKTAAIKGLAIVGTRESVVDLGRIAGDEKNLAREAAREALKLIQQRGME